MSIHSEMTLTFEVWKRIGESDTWLQIHPELRGSLRPLTPDGARRQTAGGGVIEPEITHVVRMGEEATELDPDGEAFVVGGRRLRNQADGKEYTVHLPRWQEKPRPGNLKVTVASVDAGTQG